MCLMFINKTIRTTRVIRTDNECSLTRTGMAACARLWGNAAETRLEGGDEGDGCKAAIVPESSLIIAALVLVLRCFDMQSLDSLYTTCPTECVACRECRSRMIVCSTTEVARLWPF